jgi:hypothetical protein
MPTITVVRIYADGSGDFTSLKAGWDANKTNLVTADVALEFELKGNLINTDAFVDATGYTTDVTRNITIRPIAGDETTSVAGTSGTVYGTNTFILVCRSEFVLFKNLEVDGFSNPFHTASNLTVQGCLIHDGTLVADTVGASVSNTIIYNCAANTLDNVDCDQVTIVSKTSMITTMYRNAGGVLTRNVAYNTSAGNVNYSNTTNASNDENASDDTTAPGTTTFSVSTSDFVNYASDDFDIDSGSSLFTAGSGGTRIGALLTVSGGVTVTPSTIDSLSVSNNPTITFNSVLSITPNTIDSLSTANNPTVQFNSVVNISPTAINSSSVSNNPIVSFSAVLNITPQAIDSSSSANNPVIVFNNPLNISPTTIDSLSISNNPVIEFKSVINVLPQVVDSLSVSINPFISFGVVQTIGNVTASFKDSGISVKYEEDQITVNFK